MLLAAPVRVVPPVAAETTKNPGWSVADEYFPPGLKKEQQATSKEGIGSRTGKGGRKISS